MKGMVIGMGNPIIPRLGQGGRRDIIAREVYQAASAIEKLLAAAAVDTNQERASVLREYASQMVEHANPAGIGSRLDAEVAAAEEQQKKWEEEMKKMPPAVGDQAPVHREADTWTPLLQKLEGVVDQLAKSRQTDDVQRIAAFPLFLLGYVNGPPTKSRRDEVVCSFARKHLADERFPLDGTFLSDFRNFLDETNQRDDNEALSEAWAAFVEAEETESE